MILFIIYFVTMGAATAEQPQNKNLFGEVVAISRSGKIAETRKKNSSARNERIRLRFNELFNDRRIRYDDVMNTLALEFCLAQSTIMKMLKKRD
jgi:hypothetical protein